MLYKHGHTKHKRLRSWRRFQEERVVRNRLKTNPTWYRWYYDSYETGGIEYGMGTWVDLLSESCGFKTRTSFSYKKSRWDYENKYQRNLYKKQTKRLLSEEGIYK